MEDDIHFPSLGRWSCQRCSMRTVDWASVASFKFGFECEKVSLRRGAGAVDI